MFNLRRALASVILLLCIALAPTAAQDNLYIAFSSDRDGDEDIYIIRPDGSDLLKLTDSPARDYHPTWSPDGRFIAFVSNRTGDSEIFIIANNGDGVNNVTNTPAFEERAPDWSPDGRFIVFTSNRDGGWDLYTLDTNSGDIERLTTDAREKSAPAWFPDSQRIAYWAAEDGSTALFVVDRVTRQRTQLTAADGSSWPALSPDGGTIAYESTIDGTKQIFIRDLAANSPAQQITTTAENVQPHWSPDGQQIIYVSTRADAVDLYMMNRDGSGIQQITSGAGNDLAPAWQPVPATILPPENATPTPSAPNTVPEDSFSLGQSFERVTGSIPADQVETLGNSEARLVPEPPYSMGADGILTVRVEIQVLPDGTVTAAPASLGATNIGRVNLDAYTYMRAEIVGIDRDRFEIYPSPEEEPYMIRLRADQVNFWEWQLRPKPNAVGQTNYLAVKFALPEREEDGTIITQEGEGVLRFEIEVGGNEQPVQAMTTPTTVPEMGLRLVANGPDTLTVVARRDTTIDQIGIRSSRGEGWLDQDFGRSGDFPANGCLAYVREGVDLSLPGECNLGNTDTIVIPYGDVFWYDYRQEMVVGMRIVLQGRYHIECSAASASNCEF